jgi:CcmD family protein
VVNKYLFLAYAFVWVIFILYAWNLSRRQAVLKKELDELKEKVAGYVSPQASGKAGS